VLGLGLFCFFLPSGRCILVHFGPSSLNIMMRRSPARSRKKQKRDVQFFLSNAQESYTSLYIRGKERRKVLQNERQNLLCKNLPKSTHTP
jgi:hypothetical protein